MKPAIVCVNVRKRYTQRKKDPVDALRGLDLEVRCGECFGLLGPNGAGKTTAVEILEGLLMPTSGEVVVLGESWGRGNDRLRQRLGISLQETRLADKLTALETLRLFRSFYRDGHPLSQVLKAVGLTEKQDSYVAHLSGGQRQRLAVACALVGRPELLFLDEPTTGLDPRARREVWDVIHRQRALGTTIVLTTHYMDEAEKLCDRVAVVDHGKVIALGTPRELISSLGGGQIIEFGLASAERRAMVDRTVLGALPGVRSLHEEGSFFILTVEQSHESLPALLRYVDGNGHAFEQLTTRHASLEDVFVSLTGRHLSDED